MANGEGEFRGVNGSFYKGLWKDDRPNGKGIETNKNGEIYDGEFLDGRKHGYGEMNFKDGSIYKGNFRMGEMHGKVRFSPQIKFNQSIGQLQLAKRRCLRRRLGQFCQTR
jgi:hypothetical protein